MFPGIRKVLLSALLGAIPGAIVATQGAMADELSSRVQQEYDSHLEALFEHFHRNPELSTMEVKTAARLATELRGVGFKVTEGVGGTGVVALLENGPGPLSEERIPGGADSMVADNLWKRFGKPDYALALKSLLKP